MHDFDKAFQDQLTALMRWRRDVRRFRTDPVPEAMLMHCLDAFVLAPSVGLSQPWRLIRVESAAARAAALANFEAANAQALAGYDGPIEIQGRSASHFGATSETPPALPGQVVRRRIEIIVLTESGDGQ